MSSKEDAIMHGLRIAKAVGKPRKILRHKSQAGPNNYHEGSMLIARNPNWDEVAVVTVDGRVIYNN